MEKKTHVMVIEINGRQAEIEIDQPLAIGHDPSSLEGAHQALAMMRLIRDNLNSFDLKATTEEDGSQYQGWAKVTIYIGGRTDYVDDYGYESWETDHYSVSPISETLHLQIDNNQQQQGTK